MSKILLLCAVLLFTTSFAALGNIVVSNPANTGQWYNMIAPNNNNTDAFWDNPSNDGGACNVGYWLNSANWNSYGSSNCSSDTWKTNGQGPGQSNLQFFAATSGADTPIGWYMEVTGPNAVSLQLEVAGNSGSNAFGFYKLDGSGNIVGLTQLIAPGINPNTGSVVSINANPGEFIGFYICPGVNPTTPGTCNLTSGAGAFLSGTAYTGNVSGSAGKLALFREINPVGGVQQAFWIGAEDKANTGGEGVGDYNDMLVRLTVVPEPGFYGLLSLGIGGLFLAARRRKQS